MTVENKGIIRKLDELGRIVVPKEMRKKLDIDVGTPLEIHLEGDAIVIKKDQESCIFCLGTEGISDFKGKKVCESCLAEIKA